MRRFDALSIAGLTWLMASVPAASAMAQESTEQGTAPTEQAAAQVPDPTRPPLGVLVTPKLATAGTVMPALPALPAIPPLPGELAAAPAVAASSPVPAAPQLQAILRPASGLAADTRALVDGHVLAIGQDQAGYRLLSVNKRSARVQWSGKVLHLSLYSPAAPASAAADPLAPRMSFKMIKDTP